MSSSTPITKQLTGFIGNIRCIHVGIGLHLEHHFTIFNSEIILKIIIISVITTFHSSILQHLLTTQSIVSFIGNFMLKYLKFPSGYSWADNVPQHYAWLQCVTWLIQLAPVISHWSACTQVAVA